MKLCLGITVRGQKRSPFSQNGGQSNYAGEFTLQGVQDVFREFYIHQTTCNLRKVTYVFSLHIVAFGRTFETRQFSKVVVRWVFINENKIVGKQENTLSTGKAMKKKRNETRSRPRKRYGKKRKNDNGQEKEKENTLSTKKATKKKRKTFIFSLSCFLL